MIKMYLPGKSVAKAAQILRRGDKPFIRIFILVEIIGNTKMLFFDI